MVDEVQKLRAFYYRLLNYIGQGDVELEQEARELVLNLGVSEKNLESALKEGNDHAYRKHSAYARVCLHIAGGDLELESIARRLAGKYNITPATDLDLALHIGKSYLGEHK